MAKKTASLARQSGDETEKEYWWQSTEADPDSCRIRPRPGHTCLECGEGTFAYDGLFILTCNRCGYVAESGASW